MKKYKGFILVGIILALLIPIFALSETKEEEILVDIFKDVGADFEEASIDSNGIIVNKFIEEEEIKKIGKEIKDELDIQGEEYVEGQYYWQEITQEEGFIQLMGQGYDGSKNLVTFTISSYEDGNNGLGETFLFINIIKREQFMGFNDIINKVENIFEKYDVEVDITRCIIGTFDEKLDLAKNKKRILEANKAVKGKIIEQYEDEEVLSYSIFTPYIEEHIYTGSKKMNLNMAVGYNEEENKSYIMIGTPIITIGY